jgi:serine/threonine protein kinase
MIEGTELFSQVQDTEGNYDPKAHLAEMIALLGPPPKKLLVVSDSMAEVEWSPAITDERGKIFKNNRDYFGGPFFDDEGRRAITYRLFNLNKIFTLIVLGQANSSTMTLYQLENLKTQFHLWERRKENFFFSFVKEMLAWLPEERKTAQELMEHPFLND